MSFRVELSCPSILRTEFSAAQVSGASCLPSSTLHWSKLLICQFTPVTAAAPAVSVILPPVAAYDRLLARTASGVAA